MVNVPRYSELNVKAIWEIVKEKQNIARCLPDYTKSQLPERNYLLNIIATVDEDFLMKIVNHAHNLRLPKKINKWWWQNSNSKWYSGRDKQLFIYFK